MAEGRNSIRHRITVQGKYRTGSGKVTEVSVVDLSETGCRLFANRAGLSRGQIISLRIETLGPFEATVVWNDNGLFGVRFAKALYGPVFDHICTVLDTPEWRPIRP